MKCVACLSFALFILGCSEGPDGVRIDGGGSDAGVDADMAGDAGARDGGPRDGSTDAPPWSDGGAAPSVVWTLPPCAAAHGVLSRDIGIGSDINLLAHIDGFDATVGLASVVANQSLGFVWQTISESGAVDETLPLSLGSRPAGVVFHTDGPHVLALTYGEALERDAETSLSNAGMPRTYHALNGGNLLLPSSPEIVTASSAAGIDIFAWTYDVSGAVDCGVCAMRVGGDGATLSPLRAIAPGRASETRILLFDEVTRRGMVIEEMFEGSSRLYVTAFNDTTVGAFREVVDPYYVSSPDVSPVIAAIAGDRVVIVYRVAMGTDVAPIPRYVELSLDTGEVVSPPEWWRLGEPGEAVLVLTQGADGTVDMFRQPFAPYDMPEQFTDHPVEIHLRRPLPLDVAPLADVLQLGAGGWVDDVRAERVGPDVWVAWHETGPCQGAAGEFPPLECVGGAYWALLRCDGG